MDIPKKELTHILELAKEGKHISKIKNEDYPERDYWDLYAAIYGGGEKSILGVKRAITNRLSKLSSATKKTERDCIIGEVVDLIDHLYRTVKSSQKKIQSIRKHLNPNIKIPNN